MNDIKKGIQYAFQTENNMTLSMSGSGHAAMECAVFNTVEPGESVLISINGIWGERVAEIAERMGRFMRTDFTHVLVQNTDRALLSCLYKLNITSLFFL